MSTTAVLRQDNGLSVVIMPIQAIRRGGARIRARVAGAAAAAGRAVSNVVSRVRGGRAAAAPAAPAPAQSRQQRRNTSASGAITYED